MASVVRHAGGHVRRSLPLINGLVVDIPNAALQHVADDSAVARVSLDRKVVGTMERTGATIGAAALRQELGYDGAGVGVAIIDSGITAWHDDLGGAGGGAARRPLRRSRQRPSSAYDDYGHGTHVAGIVAGNGFDSAGARTGIAPGAHLVVLKVLDASGSGRISDVIAALDYVVAHKDALNIRVVNLSVATGVYESYNTDPLTLAAQACGRRGNRRGRGGRQPRPQSAWRTTPTAASRRLATRRGC